MNLPLKEYYDLLEKYLRPQWRKVLVLLVLLFGGIGLQLYAPQIIRSFIDAAQAGATIEMLMNTGVLFLVVTLLRQAVRMGAAYLTADVKWQATNWLRNDLSDHCLQLDMRFHNDHTPGAMIERIDGDVTELSNFFSQFIMQVLANGLFLLGVLALLYSEDWRFGVAFTVYALVVLLSMAKTVGLGAPFWKARRQASSEMFGLIEEWLGGTEDIRANGGTGYVMDQFQRAIRKLFLATRKAWFIGDLTWGMSQVFYAISISLALGLGGYLLSINAVTLGAVYLVLHYGNELHWPIEDMARQFKDLQAATAAIERIRELLETEPVVTEVEEPLALPNDALSVAFEGVTFGYVKDEPILHGVDFRLEAGKVLGLLGRTGSGKTTMTRLLFRLYDPGSGTVALGGQDLRTVALDDVRGRVGMVTQEVQLFEASVRENLALFDDSIRDEDIHEAIELLGLTRWFDGLEDGLDTKLDTGGRGLSAGEAQLLAFTRVFLKDPGLVILDEASSRLDPVTEQLIERAIDRLLYGRTAIIVAHRLATVQRADEIMILQDGRIVEHDERVALSANPDSRFSQLLRTGMEELLV